MCKEPDATREASLCARAELRSEKEEEEEKMSDFRGGRPARRQPAAPEWRPHLSANCLASANWRLLARRELPAGSTSRARSPLPAQMQEKKFAHATPANVEPIGDHSGSNWAHRCGVFLSPRVIRVEASVGGAGAGQDKTEEDKTEEDRTKRREQKKRQAAAADEGREANIYLAPG